jgi:predicted nucleotide-binding protein
VLDIVVLGDCICEGIRMAKEKTAIKENGESSKRSYMSQNEFPRIPLAKALSVAKALWDNFAGKSAAPYDIALALEYSPTSGGWRSLCGSSIAYGLTSGGYNASEISLTELGKRIVAPTTDGDDLAAKVEAILHPRAMREFYEKYNKAKFPKENIAENVLVSLGIPKDRAQASVEIIRENGIYTGILKDTKTGLFLALGSPAPTSVAKEEEKLESEREIPASSEEIDKDVAGNTSSKPEDKIKKSNKVYISHGKNKKIVVQLKELLTFGKFDPVVSIEQETTSIPVPDKVFDDMRTCSAAVIHVSSEGELLDPEGNKHAKINENVLIEIGAAIALYGKNFVLLVQNGISLPSNLQGLYRCEYEGENLDYEATMKLLKTFNQFK